MSAPAKFVVPRIPSATLKREELLGRLDAGGDSVLTLVSAGPGSGKSALLATWAERLPTVRWLSCEPEHADPDRFWHDLAAAIDDTGFEILGAADPRQRATELIGALGAANPSAVVVIDDFHNAVVDPSDVMDLLSSLPSNVRLTLSTRADPALPLGRLRVQGRLLELRQSDLRFTLEESAALLASLGVDLDRPELEKLEELTDGWTAGVQLAGLSLQANPRPVALLQSLSETNRSLVDFLMNEVIDLQPPGVRDFLLVTAELETFDAELCDAVRGSADSAAMIDAVRAANLFLVQVDPDAGWFRYHHLFGRFLQARLRATGASRIAGIHRAAAAACVARSMSLSAIRHHAKASDMEAALASLLSHVGESLSLEDRALGLDVSKAWLAEFGDDALQGAPASLIYCVFVLTSATTTSEPEVWLRRIAGRESELDADAQFLLHAVWSFYLQRRGDPVGSLEQTRLAREVVRTREVETPWARIHVVTPIQDHIELDDLDAAQREIESARTGVEGIATMSEVRIPGLASLVAAHRGELTEAERLARHALAGADRLGLHARNFGRAEPLLALGIVAFERRDLDAAEARFESAMRIVEGGARPNVERWAHLELAKLDAARGDGEEAADRVAQARGVVPFASAEVVASIDRVEARLRVDRGDLGDAATLVNGLPPSAAKVALEARVLLATDERAKARALLEQERPVTRRRSVERWLLLARAAPDDVTAEAALRDALALAQPAGIEQSIVCEDAEITALLDRLSFDGSLGPYVHRLRHSDLDATPVVQQPGLVDPLSDRELTVLRCLTSPQDARQIADTLYLSVNTVRTHVKAIYRKLDVSSRADAVSEAKRLGLL